MASITRYEFFHAVAGVPEDRHTLIITWPSDDAKSHDATARLKEFLVAGNIKRDFDHNHTRKLARRPFPSAITNGSLEALTELAHDPDPETANAAKRALVKRRFGYNGRRLKGALVGDSEDDNVKAKVKVAVDEFLLGYDYELRHREDGSLKHGLGYHGALIQFARGEDEELARLANKALHGDETVAYDSGGAQTASSRFWGRDLGIGITRSGRRAIIHITVRGSTSATSTTKRGGRPRARSGRFATLVSRTSA